MDVFVSRPGAVLTLIGVKQIPNVTWRIMWMHLLLTQIWYLGFSTVNTLNKIINVTLFAFISKREETNENWQQYTGLSTNDETIKMTEIFKIWLSQY